MFRMGALKFGAGAAAAATASATGRESQARVRPSLFSRATGNGEEKTAEAEAVTEEDLSGNWIPFDLEGDKVIFERDEIREGIEDMFSLRGAGLLDNSDTESIESFGLDADNIIANAGASSSIMLDSSSGIDSLASLTQRLLSRPTIQKEVLDAIREDPGMHRMFNQLAESNGADLHIRPFNYRQPPPLAIEAPADQHEANILEKIVQRVGQVVEETGHEVSKVGHGVGGFLKKFGRWIKTQIGKEHQQVPLEEPAEEFFREGPQPVEVELHPAEKVVGAVVCLAGAVVVIMVAKRLGLLRFIRV